MEILRLEEFRKIFLPNSFLNTRDYFVVFFFRKRELRTKQVVKVEI